jgi:hypothetical protein
MIVEIGAKGKYVLRRNQEDIYKCRRKREGDLQVKNEVCKGKTYICGKEKCRGELYGGGRASGRFV